MAFFTTFVFLLLQAHTAWNAEDQRFIKDALKTHNFLRRIHFAPPLKFDKELSKIAKRLANKAAQHEGFAEVGEGENVYESVSTGFSEITGEEVSKAW